ncbi:DUF6252 family protein [Flavobacterium okayamense]|uniref:Lipoprotein n=1 Tax=Flavobacterium okayamense TaxID=2830782 RepID=A0ABM7S3H9_9FLAO|nr:DUF6252 family protein [Flavobacterium okayamense]BCY28071.1 hypothetical protein KK2020170_09390 [Flavobacterium okayamense]
MKKIFGLLSLALILSSCSEEIKNSTPGFQAKKDNVFWRATDASAHVNADGSLTISAYNSSTATEELILNASSANPGTYRLGTTNFSNFAYYYYELAGEGFEYETNTVTGPANDLSNILTQGTNYENNGTASVTGGTGSGAVVAVSVVNGSVSFVTLMNRGAGYNVGDVLTVHGGNDDATFMVNTIYSNGAIQTVELLTGGSSYENVGTGALTDTDGNGSGLRVAINVNNLGRVTSMYMVSRGDGYQAGDLVTILGGDNNATFRILNVQQSSGEIVIESVENGTFTGTFIINAVDMDGNPVTFSEGVFYRIPIR